MRMIFFLGLFIVGSANAADITAVSGVYTSQDYKASGKTLGSERNYGAGGTYQDILNDKMSYLATAGLDFSNYSGGDAGSPDNFTGVNLGGGVRYYFTPFNTYTVPFAGASLKYKSSQSVDFAKNGYTKRRTSGIFYEASAGIRIGLNQKFFMELELPFFSSPLQSNTKTTVVTQSSTSGQTSSDDSEENDVALWGKSYQSMTAIVVGLGMKI